MAGVGAISVSVNGFATVVNQNLNRSHLWLQNMSTNGQIIYLVTGTGPIGNPVYKQGVRLNPNGGMWETTGIGWVVATSSTSPAGLVIGWEA